MGEAYGGGGRGGDGGCVCVWEGVEPHTTAASQADEGERAHPGRGAPLSADLSPWCNNGHDNDTGGGISAAPYHTHISPPHRGSIKNRSARMNGFLIAFICYNYHN